jgi:dTDP-4-amino-4,6-dideoxygalactose transaminase
MRDDVRVYLEERGVATGIHYPIALPNLAAYAYLKHKREDLPQATKASEEILSLPMFPELTDAQIDYVCESVTHFLSRRSLPQ